MSKEEPAGGNGRFTVIDEFFKVPKHDSATIAAMGARIPGRSEKSRGKEANRSAGPSTSNKVAASAAQGKKITVWVGDSDSN